MKHPSTQGSGRVAPDTPDQAASSAGRGKTAASSKGRSANGLVALSSAAVMAIYAAGYVRTRAVSAQFESAAGQRRPAHAAERARFVEPAGDEASQPREAAGLTVSTATTATADAKPAGIPAPAAVTSATPPVAGGPGLNAAASKPAVPAPAAAAVAANSAPAKPSPAPAQPQPAPSVVVSSAPAASAAPAQETTTGVQPAAPAQLAASSAAGPVTPPVTAVPPAAAAQTGYKDGTYLGWGSSRHGDIQAQVVIESGKITAATIAQCLTRYPCSWITPLPPQVVKRQSAEVDYVSGATVSADAFYYAIVEALSKAK